MNFYDRWALKDPETAGFCVFYSFYVAFAAPTNAQASLFLARRACISSRARPFDISTSFQRAALHFFFIRVVIAPSHSCNSFENEYTHHSELRHAELFQTRTHKQVFQAKRWIAASWSSNFSFVLFVWKRGRRRLNRNIYTDGSRRRQRLCVLLVKAEAAKLELGKSSITHAHSCESIFRPHTHTRHTRQRKFIIKVAKHKKLNRGRLWVAMCTCAVHVDECRATHTSAQNTITMRSGISGPPPRQCFHCFLSPSPPTPPLVPAYHYHNMRACVCTFSASLFAPFRAATASTSTAAASVAWATLTENRYGGAGRIVHRRRPRHNYTQGAYSSRKSLMFAALALPGLCVGICRRCNMAQRWLFRFCLFARFVTRLCPRFVCLFAAFSCRICVCILCRVEWARRTWKL